MNILKTTRWSEIYVSELYLKENKRLCWGLESAYKTLTTPACYRGLIDIRSLRLFLVSPLLTSSICPTSNSSCAQLPSNSFRPWGCSGEGRSLNWTLGSDNGDNLATWNYKMINVMNKECKLSWEWIRGVVGEFSWHQGLVVNKHCFFSLSLQRKSEAAEGSVSNSTGGGVCTTLDGLWLLLPYLIIGWNDSWDWAVGASRWPEDDLGNRRS